MSAFFIFEVMIAKIPNFFSFLFPNFIWQIPNTENKIFLSFDDGPIPEVTEFVLEELNKYNAKATFFCIGDNIQKHPEIFAKIIKNNHSVGNHTFNHLKGWKTPLEKYIENTARCEVQILNSKTQEISNPEPQTQNFKPKLFRPPYGRIKISQAKKLRKLGYKIVMWNVLSVDYSSTISPEKCIENVLKNTKTGSIIVFHDSIKAFPNLKIALPVILRELNKKAFVFEKID